MNRVFFALLHLTACGRYGPPLAPEILAPAATEELEVIPEADGVRFKWRASDVDLQPKELKTSTGFKIMRKELINLGDETDKDIPFKEISFLPDDHVEVREALRKAARAQGKVGRRIEAPDEKMLFEFKDTTVEKKHDYLYKIIPINQGDVKGAVAKIVRVNFIDETSKVLLIDQDEIDLAGGGSF